MKIDAQVILKRCRESDPTKIFEIVASNKQIKNVANLSKLKNLGKLNLSGNKIANLAGISVNSNITWLNVSDNALDNIDCLKRLHRLCTLNAANNQLTSVCEFEGPTVMKALVVNKNKLKDLSKLFHTCPLLNTVVVSDNELEDLKGIESLKELKKLSASNNRIKSLGWLNDMVSKQELCELRLCNNGIEVVPECIEGFKGLRIIDLGKNQISSIESLMHLRKLKLLRNLNLKGNPITKRPDYEEIIAANFPDLNCLDGKRIFRGPKLCTSSASTTEIGHRSSSVTGELAGVLRSNNRATTHELILRGSSEVEYGSAVHSARGKADQHVAKEGGIAVGGAAGAVPLHDRVQSTGESVADVNNSRKRRRVRVDDGPTRPNRRPFKINCTSDLPSMANRSLQTNSSPRASSSTCACKANSAHNVRIPRTASTCTATSNDGGKNLNISKHHVSSYRGRVPTEPPVLISAQVDDDDEPVFQTSSSSCTTILSAPSGTSSSTAPALDPIVHHDEVGTSQPTVASRDLFAIDCASSASASSVLAVGEGGHNAWI
eukprot:Nk52_evm6s2297 gene=Nk52_evmTU6s2297